jgi:hypothetical protein
MKFQFVSAALSICFLPTSLFANDGAPAQLRNKTITVAWTAQSTVMTPRGEKQSPQFTQQRTIYVSTAGNVFIKSRAEGAQGTKEAEMAPGDKTPVGGDREVHFVGGKLVAIAQRGSGAGRMVISFDPSYSSCSVDVTFGRPAGEKMTFRNQRGVMVELLGVTFSGQRCSIRDGNAFAN